MANISVPSNKSIFQSHSGLKTNPAKRPDTRIVGKHGQLGVHESHRVNLV